jgi:hypothetical protein
MTQKVALTCDSATPDGMVFTHGLLQFVPSFTRLGDPSDQVLIEQAAARAVFDDSGTPPVIDLFPCDLIGPQDGDNPGWTYSVIYEGCPGNPPPWSFYLLSTGGDAQRLSSLAEVPAAAPYATGADKNYTQAFSVASTVTVGHNLGKYPSVTVFDSAGDQVEGEPTYTDLNNLTLTFSAPFSGTVTCN